MLQGQPQPLTSATRRSTADTSTARAAEVDSTRLLRGQREVVIRHGDEVYRLRHTRNDKLILTK